MRVSDDELKNLLEHAFRSDDWKMTFLVKELQSYRAVMPKVRAALKHVLCGRYEDNHGLRPIAQNALALLDQLEKEGK